MDAIPQCLLMLEDDLSVVAANAAFRRMFAAGSEHVVGSAAAWLHQPALAARLRSALETDASCEIETLVPLLGRRRLVLHPSRLSGRERGTGSIMLAIDDVTDRVWGAATPPGWGSLLAAAAHDIRQPLQAISLLGALLGRRVTDPDLRRLIGRLDDTIGVMSGMLNTLLDLNRRDADAIPPHPADFALGDLFSRVRGEFAEKMRAHGLRWQVIDCQRNVHSDQRLLTQMVRNLILYAVEHSHDGRMLLGARRCGEVLRIELWDTGFESVDADMQALYDEWQPQGGQAAVLSRNLAPGLSLVRRLADLLGHRIDVGFKPGRGSVFSIEVPLAAAQAEADPRHAALGGDPDRVTRGTVFVVDDDARVRETMRDLLDATGWATEIYATSEQFLNSDHVGRTGCILIDALMPGMNGIDLLRALKPQRHRLPAIMLTGAGDVRMAVEAMAAGALNFIEKPVRYEELLPSIERAFDLLVDSSRLSMWRESSASRVATLTARQRQILDRVLAGEPSRKIAEELGVSRRTVENHRAAIMKKMGAASIPALIRAGIAAT